MSHLKFTAVVVVFTFWAIVSPSGGVAGDSEVTPAAPSIGEPVECFEATDEQGQPWSSLKQAKGKYLVVFFQPGDFKFCTLRQAQKYNAAMKELTELGAVVVSVSGDTPETHRLFKASHLLEFTLLSDFDGHLARKFNVPLRDGGCTPAIDAGGRPIVVGDKPLRVKRGVTPPHWTFIIGKDGTLLYRNTQVSPLADSQDVSQFIRNLKTEAAVVQTGGAK